MPGSSHDGDRGNDTHCLGAAAARLQARIALEELVRRIPRFTVDPHQIVWAPGAYVRRPISVPLTVG